MTRPLSRTAIYIGLGAIVVFAIGPVLLAWFAAFKSPDQLVTNPYGPPIPPHAGNLTEAWTVGKFGTYFRNSLIISVVDSVAMVVIASLGGYAFARLRFPGQKIILVVLLFGLTIPVTALIIPLFLVMRDFHLLDRLGSVIIADVALAAPFFIFLMRGFFKDVPRELEDAGRIDGCSEFGLFWRVMIPLVRPGLAAVVLLEFLWSWNDLLLPLVFLITDSKRTLPVGLLFFQGQYSADWGLIFAGVLILSAPVIVIFLVFQRGFVRGLVAGSVKG